MKRALVVIDMQNDFITGSLANVEGQKIVPKIADYISDFPGDIIVTRDTHHEDYMETQEGRRLPVPHCIEDSEGWEIVPEIQDVLDDRDDVTYINKHSFGSIGLGEFIKEQEYTNVELVGVCTDICVINNAMVIKAAAPEANIAVHRELCAGVTPDTHRTALAAMSVCQIDII